MERFRASLATFWSDVDRRRAFMLSLVAHLCVLLLFVLWLTRPQPVPLEQFLVIDLGTPEQAERPVEAPTVADPAPAAPTPQVQDEEMGEPQARTSPSRENVTPDPEARTEQPRPQPVTSQPQRSEQQPARQAPEEQREPEAAGEAPVAPAPRVREPQPQASAPDLPVASAATVLPEIEEVEIEPSEADRPVNIPQPQASARVPQARNVAVTPAAEVAAPRDIPAPAANASVAAAEAIPQPSVSSQVAEAVPVPRPQAAAEVAQASAVPRPGVAADVTPTQAVPVPAAAVDVAGGRPVPLPGVQAEVPRARPVAVSAQAAVSRPLEVPTPSIRARVEAPEAETGAAMAGAAPAGAAPAPSNRLDDRPAGGDAQRSSQDTAVEEARAGELGRAADLEEGDATGAESLRPRVPYREERERPLAVLLDNAAGYPQVGLAAASRIAEMPVEGGLTRLMAMYDRRDPEEVGPIRSARDYFVDLAQEYDGVLVHDGGSPAALAAIDRSGLPTLNAYRFGDLFSRQPGRQAPYNLYSSGGPLREAVNRLRLDRSQELQGVVPRPPEDAPEAHSVEVRYGGTYRSGFSYIRELDIYRWRRNGENAVDARGEAILVEAVLLARINARPIPDDPAGRLYIPLRGGEATLYLRGKAIDGRWLPDGGEGQGIGFVRSDGEPMDLTPFRLWLLFAPQNAQLAQQ